MLRTKQAWAKSNQAACTKETNSTCRACGLPTSQAMDPDAETMESDAQGALACIYPGSISSCETAPKGIKHRPSTGEELAGQVQVTSNQQISPPKPSRTQRLCTLSSSLLVILASPPPTTGRNPSFLNVASQGQGPLLWSPSHAIRAHMSTSSQKDSRPNPPFSMPLPRSHGMELCSVSVCGLDKKAAQLETRPSALSSQRA